MAFFKNFIHLVLFLCIFSAPVWSMYTEVTEDPQTQTTRYKAQAESQFPLEEAPYTFRKIKDGLLPYMHKDTKEDFSVLAALICHSNCSDPKDTNEFSPNEFTMKRFIIKGFTAEELQCFLVSLLASNEPSSNEQERILSQQNALYDLFAFYKPLLLQEFSKLASRFPDRGRKLSQENKEKYQSKAEGILPLKENPYLFEEVQSALTTHMHEKVAQDFDVFVSLMYHRAFPPARHSDKEILMGYRYLYGQLCEANELNLEEEEIIKRQQDALDNRLGFHKSTLLKTFRELASKITDLESEEREKMYKKRLGIYEGH